MNLLHPPLPTANASLRDTARDNPGKKSGAFLVQKLTKTGQLAHETASKNILTGMNLLAFFASRDLRDFI